MLRNVISSFVIMLGGISLGLGTQPAFGDALGGPIVADCDGEACKSSVQCDKIKPNECDPDNEAKKNCRCNNHDDEDRRVCFCTE